MPKWLREALETFDDLFGIDLIALWEGLTGGDEDQKPIWMVSTDDFARNKLKRWEAELFVKRLRRSHELVLLGKDDGDGQMTIVKTYRKDASMSEESPQVRELRKRLAEKDRQIESLRSAGLPVDIPQGVRRVHIVVEDTEIAAMSHGASRVAVTDQDANELTLGQWHEMPCPPDMARSRHLVIPVAPVETSKEDASMSDTKTERIPIHASYDQREGPIGFVDLPEHLAKGVSLGSMVLAPGGRVNEQGRIVEVLEFGLIPSETFDPRGDAVPVRVGDGAVVGHVRISENMVFQHGALEDLELVPIEVVDEEPPEEGPEQAKVAGYRIVNRTMRVRSIPDDLEPGTYIFRLDDDRKVRGLEAIPAKHVLEMREDGYSLQHPYECRAGGKSLHDCEMWKRVQATDKDLRDMAHRSSVPARYFITWNPETERLELENAEHAGVEASAEVQERPEPQLPPVDLSGALWGVKLDEGTSAPGQINRAMSREIAETACAGLGVLVHRKTVDSEWEEVTPDA